MPATWDVYIDWDGDGGLGLGGFEPELGEGQWEPGGTVLPALARSTVRAHNGVASLLVTWGTGGTFPIIGRWVHGLTPGTQYTWSAWVWVPTGSPDVVLAVGGIGLGLTAAGVDTWKRLTQTFTATGVSHQLQVWPGVAPTSGQQWWFDEPMIAMTGEDVTTRALDRGAAFAVQYGRDQARSLSPVAPGRAELELNNSSRDYSPENSSSPLAGHVLPARPVRIQANLTGVTHTLFRGHLDDYEVLPDTNTRSVRITAVDLLGDLDATVSVPLQFSIRTGQAIHLLLDQVGWPTEDRDIDLGATTIRWYWEERANALTALQGVVSSEGIGALAYVNTDGVFVFRDRHHRLTRTASTVSQATFRGSGTVEPIMTTPLVYDHGWRDIINSVTLSVPERNPAPELTDVWTSTSTYTIDDGQTLLINAEASDPFYAAVNPEAGIDYTLSSGVVTIVLSYTSGQSTTMYVTAVGGPATITDLKLRAYPVRVTGTRQIHVEEPVSIKRYGRRSYPLAAPWVDVNDAEAIAQVTLAHRAERLPQVRIRLISANDTRLQHQLQRRISDRITIIDTETGLNADFWIERIEHRVIEGGLFLETVFGCEKVPTQPTSVFRFDVSGAGFNDGRFGSIGLDDPSTIFLFDTAGRGFDQGMLAH